MTIVVAAAAPDGIVLASDSRTTMMEKGQRHRVASDHTRKVFAPFNAIGMATHGTAFIGGRTVAGVMEEFIAQRPTAAGTMVADVSRDVATFFGELLTEDARARGRDPVPGTLGLIVAGYDPEGVGRIHEVLLPRSEDREAVIAHEVNTHGPGVLFRGRTRYVRRMVEGYDRDALKASGTELPSDIDHELSRLGYILSPPLSPQDALDMAVFIVRMTVDMERMTDGTYAWPGDVPACGGATQALLVSGTGSRWLAAPQLRPSDAGLSEQG